MPAYNNIDFKSLLPQVRSYDQDPWGLGLTAGPDNGLNPNNYFKDGYWFGNSFDFNQDPRGVMSMFNPGMSEPDAGQMSGNAPNSWMVYKGLDDPQSGAANLNGSPYDVYDNQGNFVRSDIFEGITSNNPTRDALIAGTMMLGGMGATIAGAGGAAAAGGAAGGGGGGAAGAGFTGAAAGDAGLMYAGADAAAAGTLGGGYMGGAGGVAGAGAGGGIMSQIGSAIKSGASSLLGNGTGGSSGLLSSAGSWLGPAATLAGGLLGSKGQEASASSTRAMDPRMDSLFYDDLAKRTQGTMAGQMGAAQGAGSQMLQVGSSLLGQTAPNTATNPYATGIMDDMERRYNDMIAKNLQGVRGNAVGVGGLGGSRHGIAESNAITTGADNFAGQGFNFMGGLYNQDQNRLRQDWTLGSGLMSQGLNTPFQPLKNTADVYQPFTGYGTTSNNTQSGGGWGGALGGALGAAQLGKNMGWFGGASGGTPPNPYATTGGWW